MNIPSEIVSEIDGILSKADREEDPLRGIFGPARNYMQAEISDLLADFRAKRCLGKLSVHDVSI